MSTCVDLGKMRSSQASEFCRQFIPDISLIQCAPPLHPLTSALACSVLVVDYAPFAINIDVVILSQILSVKLEIVRLFR